MKTAKRLAVIMAGGSGTRFWPKSSKEKPKQLLSLTGNRSLLQMTSDRLKVLVSKKNTLVVATEMLSKSIKAQLPGVTVLAEPEGRNTMAAVCWSAWEITRKSPDACVAVLPADAYIENIQDYQKTLDKAFLAAEKDDRIVCLGIKPTFAATGYGYIEAGLPLHDGGDIRAISRFVEKPEKDKAEEFLRSGNFLWNAGIFIFKVSTFISEVRRHAPGFAADFDKMMKSKQRFNHLYKRLPKLSVDVALMEKTSRGAVVAGDFGWNDLGSWPALEEVINTNTTGERATAAGIVRAKAGHINIDSRGMIVDVTPEKMVALVGVENLIVVETKTSLLIASKERAQDIKRVVELIEKDPKLRKKYL